MNDDTRTGSITAENPKEIQFPPLRFDPEAYVEYVKDADLSEKEAHELLEAIWVIMTSFVDMRFGTHPFQQWVTAQVVHRPPHLRHTPSVAPPRSEPSARHSQIPEY